MFYYKCEQERELSLYPKDYTVLTATQNGNIVTYGAVSYNINRMECFLYNYIHKTPDKVIIVCYGNNGYPTIGILQYTGDLIIYTIRQYNQRKEIDYITYYGAIVFKNHIKVRDMLQNTYNLMTLENKNITVFRVLLGRG
jgi:hypothetical protein